MATRAPVGGDGSGNSTAAAVGATIAVVAIVIALVLGIIYFKRRQVTYNTLFMSLRINMVSGVFLRENNFPWFYLY